MSIIELNTNLFDADPDIMNADELLELKGRVENAIHQLDLKEPRNMESEAYEDWADRHEELEDLLDDILDRLETL